MSSYAASNTNHSKALLWTAVLNGFFAPPLLSMVMRVANEQKVTGRRANGRWLNLLGRATARVMFAAAIALAAPLDRNA